MQIVRAQPFITPPAAQEPLRERPTVEAANLLVQPPGMQSPRAARSVEEIRSAERLAQQPKQDSLSYMTQGGRQQRAVAAYQSLQQSDQRAYVSEVLGIDVYA